MSVCLTKLPGFKGLRAIKDFKDFLIQQTQGVMPYHMMIQKYEYAEH